MKWIKEHGLRGGVLISAIPPDVDYVRPLYDPEYDRLWKVCEDLEVPINVHGGTGAPNYGKYPVANLLFITEVGFYSQRPFVQFILSGVFERFPKLTFVMTEQGCAEGRPLHGPATQPGVRRGRARISSRRRRARGSRRSGRTRCAGRGRASSTAAGRADRGTTRTMSRQTRSRYPKAADGPAELVGLVGQPVAHPRVVPGRPPEAPGPGRVEVAQAASSSSPGRRRSAGSRVKPPFATRSRRSRRGAIMVLSGRHAVGRYSAPSGGRRPRPAAFGTLGVLSPESCPPPRSVGRAHALT